MKTIVKRPRFICSPPLNTEVPLLQGQCQEEVHGNAGVGLTFSRKANSAEWNRDFPSLKEGKSPAAGQNPIISPNAKLQAAQQSCDRTQRRQPGSLLKPLDRRIDERGECHRRQRGEL